MQKITILKSITPIEIDTHPNQESLKTALSFMNLDIVVDIRTQLSKVTKIPAEGFNIEEFVGQDLHTLSFYTNELWQALSLSLVQQQLDKHGINKNFLDTLFLTTFFNAFMDSESVITHIGNSIDFVATKREIAAKLHDYPNEVSAIILPFSFSKTAVIDWINLNWTTIEKTMDDSLEKAFPIFKASQNIEEGILIDSMKKQGKTYKEIADELSQKFPNDQRFDDDNKVKQLHHRYLKQQADIDKSFPQHTQVNQR